MKKNSSDTKVVELRLFWSWRTATSNNLILYNTIFLRCRHKENASFGDDVESSQVAKNCKEKLMLLASGTSDDLSRAYDHFHLQYVVNLRTMVESLATHTCVGESATHSEVEIIGLGKPWCAKPSLPSSLKSFRFRS